MAGLESTSAPAALYGRTTEQATLRDLVDAARRGAGGAIVVHGEAGVGKTMLLRNAMLAADDCEVLRVAGVESELNLGFAALHRLLAPLLAGMAALPDAQRHALEGSFGLREGRPDRFLVSLAALTLITERAVERPVFCVVDDAQWIDRESLEVITFIALRLQADRVALFLGVRDGADETTRATDVLPRLTVNGLTEAAARELLGNLATVPVSESVASRIITDTGCNPLALIELAADLSAEQLAGRDGLPEVLPVGARLHDHFRRQLQQLTGDAQMLLLLAASEPTGDPVVVRSAARSIDLPDEAYDVAERSRLARFVPTVEFRHPLIRSAVYSSADTGDRRRAHRALAEATDAEFNPDRRVWHLATAALGPDEEVAAELWRCADIAYARGGYAAEAAFRTRAAELTPEPRLRGPRLLAAARAHLSGGAPHAVPGLLDRAEPLLIEPIDQAEMVRIRAMAQLGFAPGTVAAALLDAARLLEPIDRIAARRVYADAVDAVMTSIQYSVDTTPREVAQSALNCAHAAYRGDDVTDLLVDGFATRLAVSYQQAFPLVRRAFDALHSERSPLDGVERFLAWLSAELWEHERGYELARRCIQAQREAGALELLRLGLITLGHHEIFRGRFDAADECRAEVGELSAVIGGNADAWKLTFVDLRAWQGEETVAREEAEFLLSPFMETIGSGSMNNCGRMALTVLELASCRYREAFTHAWHLFEDDPPAHGNQVLPDVVESAVRCSEFRAAELARERLTERANIASTPWALALLARSNALLAADSDAEAFYREALTLLGQTDVVVDVARTQLLFGEWLRRRRRHSEAREQLRSALALFESMGAQTYEKRARAELSAAGEQARIRRTDTPNKLTPQESQVSRLAATGATNAEIGAQLFISAATVDYHLRKVFRKLGINSRRELARSSFADA